MQNWSYAQSIFTAGFAGQFSIRILLFGLMELDLPTPVSNPPFWGTHLHSRVAYPHQKVIAQSNNSFGDFLPPNPPELENVIGDFLAMENLEKVKTGEKMRIETLS